MPAFRKVQYSAVEKYSLASSKYMFFYLSELSFHQKLQAIENLKETSYEKKSHLGTKIAKNQPETEKETIRSTTKIQDFINSM